MKTIEKNGVDVDAVMKGTISIHSLFGLAKVLDVAQEVEVSKSKAKSLKRKAENKKVMVVEEEVKDTMEIDTTTGGTELGAPL